MDKDFWKGNQNNCLICGAALQYLTELKKLKCEYCGLSFEANASCKKGHYICDGCHSSSALDIIEKYCLTSQLINPVEMANHLMSHPAIKMHGPEHHFLVPAVLITGYCNIKKISSEEKQK
ncbi:MAG: DUF5714 domain-containing protein, partial [Spirochaetes bacterium]|nr:DUF5714 domain-containing protein [Spirochaetota bacterium]